MGKRLTATALVIGILALAFLLFGISRPPMCIFDEYSYVSGARSLLSGQQDANPEHPPLAKYFIAVAIKVAGDNSFGWRLPGAVFGALTLVGIFLWTYLLLKDYAVAVVATTLTLLNNFLFVMARVAMLDVYYFAFVIWGVVAFTAAILPSISLTRRRLLLLFSGTMFGLGTACKWNAMVTLAVVALVAGVLFLLKRYELRQIGVPALIVALGVLPIVTYGLAFWPLCHRFHRPFSFGELESLNAYIWRYHVNCPGNPGLNSAWYTWIFRATPERGLSYLMGNFVVVWSGFLALLVCAWKFLKAPSLPEGFVTLLYAANLLQWVIIPQQRTVYYYYYPCAMFLSVALAIVLGRIQGRRVLAMRPVLILLLLASVVFIYCYPRMAALEAPYDCALGCWI